MKSEELFDVKAYLQDRGISIHESGKNVSAGWIGIKCPFCSDTSNHCGISLRTKLFSCFKCGATGGPFKLVREIEKLQGQQHQRNIQTILNSYIGGIYEEEELGEKPEEIQIPKGITKLDINECPAIVWDFIENRRYDPEVVIPKYGLMWGGISGSYKYRLIIPVYYRGRMVNFQARDVTGNMEVKYKPCFNANAVMNLNDTLFGLEEIRSGKPIVVVEGIFDQWRLQHNTVCSWGTVITDAQVELIRKKKPSKVIILFDEDAEIPMRKAMSKIWFCPVEGITLSEGDPDSLSDKEAQELIWKLTL